MFNKGQMAGLMKQAQAMQENLKKAQKELETLEVEAESGAGLVKVVMTCKYNVKKISIDQDLLTEDKEMIEDLITAGINNAVKKVEDKTNEKMGGFSIPGMPSGMKFPF